MQIFPCPFCGNRDEREFFFAAEARYVSQNTKGTVQEIWIHLPCAEAFMMQRDSVTMEVLNTTTLRAEVE